MITLEFAGCSSQTKPRSDRRRGDLLAKHPEDARQAKRGHSRSHEIIRDIFYRADFGLGQRDGGVFGIRGDERAAMAALRHRTQ